MEKTIAWVSQHYEFDSSGQFSAKEEEEKEYSDEYMTEEEYIKNAPMAMMTPFGVFRVDDSLNPFRQYKFWMGYTNFPITTSVARIIENTEGIEVFRVLTRYRFVIGVAKLFDTQQVKAAITDRVCNARLSGNELIDEIIQSNKDQYAASLKRLLGGED